MLKASLICMTCSLFCCKILTAIEPFPAITPNCSGMLQVDDIHKIYWEESGNPNGFPVIFLHGGPGSGTDEKQRTFFDPQDYRIILFDQRGCGKSIPRGCLVNNTTWHLVEDINKLREFLHIDRCLLFGGSWGSTLALAYAIKYPENVQGLILRGIFLCRQQELTWFYRDGGNHFYHAAWKVFRDYLSKEEQQDPIVAYQRYLHSSSNWTQSTSAAAWTLWELANMKSKPDFRLSLILNSKILFYLFSLFFANQNKTVACIESHYFFNKGFFETDNWLLENIHKIQEIPGMIIHGENDQICPLINAQELHKAWPASTFCLVPKAGHAADEPGILEALIDATEDFKTKPPVIQSVQ